MLISTETGVFAEHFGNEQTLKILKDAGFTAYDFSMYTLKKEYCLVYYSDYVEKAKKLRKLADELGIVCNQTHAPFPSYTDNNIEYNKTIGEYLRRALEVSGILGAKYCIVHPWNNFSAEQNAEKVYNPLLPYCKQYNVKIAVENMWNWHEKENKAKPCACSLKEDFIKHLSLVDKEWFVSCVDVGHAAMFFEDTTAQDLIKDMKDSLACLHVHDNDCRYDSHLLPFSGNIDWEKVCKALADVEYKGDMTFEACSGIDRMPLELKKQTARYMREIGEYLIERIKYYSKKP